MMIKMDARESLVFGERREQGWLGAAMLLSMCVCLFVVVLAKTMPKVRTIYEVIVLP